MSDPIPNVRERMPAIAQALTNAVLMERARDALERRLAADPRDEAALLGLGDVASFDWVHGARDERAGCEART